jgi:hypothetical protein
MICHQGRVTSAIITADFFSGVWKINQPMIVKRLSWLAVIPALWLTMWLGARTLNTGAIWYDEWWSMRVVGGSFYGPITPGETLTRLAADDPWNAPAYFLLLNVWGKLVGWTHFAARMLSLLIGILAMAWVYRLGRDVAEARVGLYAAIILGTSAFFIAYLSELRTYTLTVMFTAMCLWAYIRLIGGKLSRPTQAAFVLSLAGMVYTHYFGAVSAIGIGLYHLVFVPKTRNWWRIVALMIIAGVLFLPWAIVPLASFGQAQQDTDWQSRAYSAEQIVQTVLYTVSNGSIALLAVLVGAALRERGTRLMLVWAMLVVGLFVVGNEYLKIIIHVRLLIMVWVAVAILAALGIHKLGRSGISSALVLGVWVVAGLWNVFNPAFINALPGQERKISWPGFRTTLEILRQEGNAQDAVAFHVETPGREWLTEPVIDFYMHDWSQRRIQFERIGGLPAHDDYLHHAQQFIGTAPFVWTAVDPTVPATFHISEFQRALASQYAACGRRADLPDMQVDVYARIPDSFAPSLRFGGGIGAERLSPVTVGADGQAAIRMGWQVDANIPANTYSVGLHVLNADGSVAAQADYGLPAGQFACHLSLIPVNKLAAGSYQVNVLVYNWQTGARLTGTANGEPGERLVVGSFKIEP